MLFNSVDYLVFLPLVFLVHHALPARFRWAALLAGSYERDGTRRGTFRMMRAGAVEARERRR